MRSTRFHDALRRPAFDLADARGNNPHGTHEAAESEGRRLNGYRYETVGEVERRLDPRSRRLAPKPSAPPSQPPSPQDRPPPDSPPTPPKQPSGTGIWFLLAAAVGVAYLVAKSSDRPDEDDEDAGSDADVDKPLRENPAPSASPQHITLNVTLPQANPALAAPVASAAEPVHVTVPVMTPIVVPPPLDNGPPAENPAPKRRRRKLVAPT